MKGISLEQLKQNVKMWSETRGILAESTYEAQISKFFEERSEMFTTPDLKDSFGNQMVCLINARFLINKSKGYVIRRHISMSYFELCLSNLNFVHSAINALNNEIESRGICAEDCYGIAWEEIKKRAGLMVNKKFVKWDNLTHDQRVKAAGMGQLLDENIDINHCQSFCTEKEWLEIKANEQEYTESL